MKTDGSARTPVGCNVVKMLLVLSHGQATVERGFSINKQVETDNLTEQSLVAKRTICDYVNFVGGIEHVDVIADTGSYSSSSEILGSFE